MIKYIIVGYICLSIGTAFGYMLAAILSMSKDKEDRING